MSVAVIQALPADYAGPIGWDEIQKYIFSWITDEFSDHEIGYGESIIWGDQDITQPAYPYVSLKIISGPTAESSADEERSQSVRVDTVDEAIELHTVGPRLLTLSVSMHTDKVTTMSERATSLLARLQSAIGRKSVQSTLWRMAGMSVVARHPVSDTSLVVNGSWISRATMDIVFRITSLTKEDIGFIERTVVEGSTTSDSGDVLVTTTTIDLDVP